MAVLVTGGAGFIGSHACVDLLRAGEDVVVIDNLSNSRAEVIDKITRLSGRRPAFIRGDLLDADALETAFCSRGIDSVIHFAGLKAVGESVAQPLRYYRVNLGSTLNLLEAMKRHGCARIVFSSSATVYAPGNAMPLREDAALGPTNPYGRTKRTIEDMLRDAAASDPALSAVILRYFNPIGAHPSGELGEDPGGIPNNLLPYVVDVALGKLPFLNIYGTDYDTPDGTCVRDYIHVCDLAGGHLKALDYARAHTGAVAVNLGTGRGASVLEIVRAFEAQNGVAIPRRFAGRRPGDLPVTCADPSRARDLLNWRAERDVGQMVRDSWNFARTTLATR